VARRVSALVFACLYLLAEGVVAGENGGATIFAKRCAPCHQASAEGIPGLAPPLVGNVGRYAKSPEGVDYLIRVLLAGLAGPITVNGVSFRGAMPAQKELTDSEIAAVLTYLLEAIEKVDRPVDVSIDRVSALRRLEGSPSQTLKLRSRVVELQN
jgi:mono/diheme cytochrome c family protein